MLRSNISAALLVLTTIAPACGPGFDDSDADSDAFGQGDEAGSDSAGDEAGGEQDGEVPASHQCDFEAGEGCEPPREDEGVCEPQLSQLIAGQHFDTGVVRVHNDADSLSIEVEATAPYLLAEVHAYAGTEPVPENKGGGVVPGQFPYKEQLVDLANSWSVDIPLAELGVGCDDALNIAVHAVVVSIQDGELVFEETAWAFGPDEFRTSWGWSSDYAICCEPEPEPEFEGCTLTQGYWKTHHAYAQNPSQQTAWPLSEDTELCGQTWLDILHTDASGGDAWIILAHQAIAAELNVASGAEAPAELEQALAEAREQLAACAVADADRDAALANSALLDAFNKGEAGPEHCG